MSDLAKALLGRWLHSHEEDSGGRVVFRPASFRFPPSRGRAGFELREDGSCVDVSIGPADGPLESEGEWRLEDEVLTLDCRARPGGRRTMRVIECDGKRLVVEE